MNPITAADSWGVFIGASNGKRWKRFCSRKQKDNIYFWSPGSPSVSVDFDCLVSNEHNTDSAGYEVWSEGYVPAPSITEGLLVLVQLVMAAMTTEPWERLYSLSLYWNGTFTW